MLEIDMVNACYNYLAEYDEYVRIVREVPFLSRCIDLVLISSGGEIISIEFKIKNWRQAIEQAKNHMLGADKAYICLPYKKPTRQLLDALKEAKIGLYQYSPDNPNIMIETMPAPQNNNKVSVFQMMLKNTVETISSKTLVHC